jgi:hypothetical protein
MANPDPIQARIAKARRGKAGSIKSARSALWYAITRVEAAFRGETDKDALIRYGHLMLQACTAYAKVCESADLADRVKYMEQVLAKERADG